MAPQLQNGLDMLMWYTKKTDCELDYQQRSQEIKREVAAILETLQGRLRGELPPPRPCGQTDRLN
ncbi:MAG TPA: hypothetical protein VFW23_01160 [Tepidisphaeraceae bacterium]|nr:hypothetical protein [Tepidisphaeraceae bacterium]